MPCHFRKTTSLTLSTHFASHNLQTLRRSLDSPSRMVSPSWHKRRERASLEFAYPRALTAIANRLGRKAVIDQSNGAIERTQRTIISSRRTNRNRSVGYVVS